MPEIPIIRFPYSCYQCGNTVNVTWPFNSEITSPHSLSIVGDQLRQKEYSPVQVVDGNYANVCRHCGAPQGDHYLRTEAMHEAYVRDPHDTIEIEEQTE
ncbi:hypothetical protein [Halorubrum ezzemoulense]|uniref:hypothetical protein n=1 Tax=Halorubrum ezzemoulense TaxID=337243 RepID=UPI00114083E9|nr:hypothetical protein [Halorubrum ezzemoulense]